MLDNVTIRDATPDDLASTREIYNGYVHDSVATFEEVPPEPHEWQRRYASVRDRGLPYLVAEGPGQETANEILGYAYCVPWNLRPAYRHTVEDSIYLAPSAVGRGCGRALLEQLLERAAGAGIREVIAVVASSIEASLALHRRCGFHDAGILTRVGYKHGRWLDTVLLQRTLDDSASTETSGS
ncbi:N-acetyltransferase family protein [Haloechinothrix sp. LS1_15]|uniref:GNAT family N-acetyltransferase n=1 Tax=Haloechinothrix sp. LS1_15 TaxID=2652248 RepID=UPI002947237E|nr:N-acetyltransferase family protein [Haloechinothrix sp. LS1_15]MDV6010961.1 N-acetyltransferase [Haloechinothrix sp. LS1_15]